MHRLASYLIALAVFSTAVAPIAYAFTSLA